MTDPVQELLQGGVLEATPFPATSRYHSIALAKYTTTDGRVVGFLRRRFVPPPEDFAELEIHTVRQGDRIDNLAAQHLGDPGQFWQLCDANGVMRPTALTDTVGRAVRITLPEGVPAPSGE
jgi:hypothetical protein